MLFAFRVRIAVIALSCSLGAQPCAQARPIAYADSTTAMLAWAPESKLEAQAFYAPSFKYSFGVGWLDVANETDSIERRIGYLRANYLVKRWNLPRAQSNAFVWGSIGAASGSDFAGTSAVWNAGGQFDYETRRVYFAAKTELYRSREFRHRFDTVQAGIAPYEHDIDVLATWFVVQAQRADGGLTTGTDYSLLLRLFKGRTWFEIGAGEGGKVQTYLMHTF
jgi:hypothetical protein